MTSRDVPDVLTVKEALQQLEKWNLHAPRNNKYSHKKEAPILFDGKVVCVQIGTPKNPVYCPFGLSRWDQRANRFTTVDNPTDVAWLYQSQEAGADARRLPSTKLQAILTAHEYDVEGTQGYYTWRLVNGIRDRVIQGLVHGVTDLSRVDANGRPVIVAAADIGSAADPAERERLFRDVIVVPPFQPPNGSFAPNIKTKVRAQVKKDARGEFVALDMDLMDVKAVTTVNPATGATETTHQPTQPREHLNVFKKGCRGVFVIKFNPIQYRGREINMTIDVIKAMIVPSESLFKQVQIRYDEDNDEPMD